MEKLLQALELFLAEQMIEANIVTRPDSDYKVLHCPKIGEHGIYLHMNFAIECCDNGYDEDTCLEHLIPRLNEWE